MAGSSIVGFCLLSWHFPMTMRGKLPTAVSAVSGKVIHTPISVRSSQPTCSSPPMNWLPINQFGLNVAWVVSFEIDRSIVGCGAALTARGASCLKLENYGNYLFVVCCVWLCTNVETRNEKKNQHSNYGVQRTIRTGVGNFWTVEISHLLTPELGGILITYMHFETLGFWWALHDWWWVVSVDWSNPLIS